MATLRELRTRVASIKNIQRVTNAMQMVAAAKMRRAQDGIEAARPYAQQLDRVLRELHQSVETDVQPLFKERAPDRVTLVVVTSDRGLCGAFNSGLCRRVQTELNVYADAQVELVTVGRKGRDYFGNRGHEIAHHHADVFGQLEFARAVDIAQSDPKGPVYLTLPREVLAGEAVHAGAGARGRHPGAPGWGAPPRNTPPS